MRKLALAVGSIPAATGIVLAGLVTAPSAAADEVPVSIIRVDDMFDGIGVMDGRRCERTERDISSTVVDYSGADLFETVFRATTNRRGDAYLNDSRNLGEWIPLKLVPGAPDCTEDTAVSVTEEDPGHLFVTLLAGSGKIYQAQCEVSNATPLNSANIATACSPGFTQIPNTPV
ncbi:hypothetical protein [Streptomyces sp. NPDC049887]|uniref:hypothetical protein n=1 Tax=Streptomyces sp. NPDC049887 TaxID=3155654 RepID=UPI0034159F22